MSKPRSHRPLQWIVGILACLLTLGGGAFAVHGLLNDKVAPPKQVVHQIHIIRPPVPETPPPPPPPPPPEEEVEVLEPPPDPVVGNEPPPGTDLGIDAVGAGSGDGFGLVGKPGGRDLLASGNGGALAAYAMAVQAAIQNRLSGDPKLRAIAYTVRAKVWISSGSGIDRATLANSTGNKDLDRVIEMSLLEVPMPAMPANTPQPVNVRINSRT